MAESGRCVCGKTGNVVAVRKHVLRCPEYIAAFKAGTALDPADEYKRYQEGGKAAERQERVAAMRDEHSTRRAQQAARFAKLPDPLED